jgi:hypothetical protein
MRLDMANFTIRQIRPHIAANAVEYERSKFEEYLKITPGTHLAKVCDFFYILCYFLDGLRNTRDWLYRNRKTTVASPNSASSSTDTLQAISGILVNSFMELLQWDDQNPWPEVLRCFKTKFLVFITLLNVVDGGHG